MGFAEDPYYWTEYCDMYFNFAEAWETYHYYDGTSLYIVEMLKKSHKKMQPRINAKKGAVKSLHGSDSFKYRIQNHVAKHGAKTMQGWENPARPDDECFWHPDEMPEYCDEQWEAWIW